MTFRFPSESAEKDEGTSFQFFVHFHQRSATCVRVTPTDGSSSFS